MTSEQIIKAVTKNVRTIDRIWGTSSAIDRLCRRAGALDMIAESRPAAYALSWACETGRLGDRTISALLAMSPANFARLGLSIAETGAAVRDQVSTWTSEAK